MLLSRIPMSAATIQKAWGAVLSLYCCLVFSGQAAKPSGLDRLQAVQPWGCFKGSCSGSSGAMGVVGPEALFAQLWV